MERISEFIQSFNNILNKALSPEDVFKIELSYMLQAPDYDAFNVVEHFDYDHVSGGVIICRVR